MESLVTIFKVQTKIGKHLSMVTSKVIKWIEEYSAKFSCET
jgi:hypothetical protein